MWPTGETLAANNEHGSYIHEAGAKSPNVDKAFKGFKELMNEIVKLAARGAHPGTAPVEFTNADMIIRYGSALS